jgi:hypothetical protein
MDMGAEMPPMDDMPEATEEDEPVDPAVQIDNNLAEMETLISEVRDLVDELEDQSKADVDVNVFTGQGEEETVETGMTALSSAVVKGLKEAFAKLDSSADELAMVAETYENINKLSSAQAREFKKLASAALRDADKISGEAKAVVKLAGAMKADMGMRHDMAMSVEDDASYAEDGGFLEEGDALDHMSHADDAADDELSALMASAMDLRRSRREAILKQANNRVLKQRAAARNAMLKRAEEGEAHLMEDNADHAEDNADHAEDNADDNTAGAALEDLLNSTASAKGAVKAALAEKVAQKRADEAREQYRVKLRRAYDVGMDMQRKGLLPTTKVALDNQVDEIMQFDDRAFESFKRSIANTKAVRSVKIATDLGGVNIGVEDDVHSAGASNLTADSLSSLWD